MDDHKIVAEELKRILAEEFETAQFGDARNADEALEQAGSQDWDVVILDITMPGKSGIEVLKELKSKYRKLPVLVLSMHPANQYGAAVLGAGGDGYMTKDAAPADLVAAVRTLLAGERYVPPALAEELGLDTGPNAGELPDGHQTDCPSSALRAIAARRAVAETADRLPGRNAACRRRPGISRKTKSRVHFGTLSYAFQGHPVG